MSPVTIMSHCVQKGVIHQEAVPFSPALGLTTHDQLAARGDLQAYEKKMDIHIHAWVHGACPLSGPHRPHSVLFSGMTFKTALSEGH